MKFKGRVGDLSGLRTKKSLNSKSPVAEYLLDPLLDGLV